MLIGAHHTDTIRIEGVGRSCQATGAKWLEWKDQHARLLGACKSALYWHQALEGMEDDSGHELIETLNKAINGAEGAT